MQRFERHKNICRKGLSLVAVMSALSLCACGNVGTLIDNSSVPVQSGGERSLARIAVADGYQKTSYIVGENFDPSRMKLALTYTDGSTDSVSVTGEMLVGGFDTSDFAVEKVEPTYDPEPSVGESTRTKVKLAFSNLASSDSITCQFRLHTRGEPLAEEELPTPHAPNDRVYFGGWYKDPDFYEEIDFVTKINDETTFYARWIDVDYSEIEPNCTTRTALIRYQDEYTEFEYRVYKDIGEWYFDFEREKKGAAIGGDVDLTYEVGDGFSVRGLNMRGGAYDQAPEWGMPINKGMVTNFDTDTPGNKTVTLEFAGRTFSYPITVTEKTLPTSEGVTVSDSGELLNLSGSNGRYALPENTISVPNGFSAKLNSAVRNNVREIICPSSVTRIGDNAFEGMARLESVTVGDGVLYIGRRAFGGCANLKTLYMYAKEPPYLMDSHFLFDVATNVEIYVPTDLTDAYETSPQWSNYVKLIYSFQP